MGEKKRLSRSGQLPDRGKTISAPVERDDRVMWRFSRVRHSHAKVGWDRATAAELQQLRGKLCEVEERGMKDLVDGNRVEHIRVQTLDPRRKSLLRHAFNNEDMPAHLLRIKVSGRCRVWVSQSGNCLEFLWWDPDHWVTPV